MSGNSKPVDLQRLFWRPLRGPQTRQLRGVNARGLGPATDGLAAPPSSYSAEKFQALDLQGVRSAPPEGASRRAPNHEQRRIAELTVKHHDHVMRGIREMQEDLGKDVLSFEQMCPDSYGRQQPGFALPKDLTLTLVAGYSTPMRFKIIRCLQAPGGA